MTLGRLGRSALGLARRLEGRHGDSPRTRRVLVDARTPVNYVMVAPVHRAMKDDPRVRFYFTASEEPHRLAEIYRDAPADAARITPRRAALMKFHAYVASDFMWATLPRGTR